MNITKSYRILLMIGDHVYCSGHGKTAVAAIQDFKNCVNGECFKHVREVLASDGRFPDDARSVGKMIESQKQFYRDNGRILYDVFDERHDGEGNTMTLGRDTWAPKYDLKF